MEAPKAARATTRLPFDSSYPAHLKVLLAFLARSTGAGLQQQFADNLGRCLDFLLSYWASASYGAFCEVAQPGLHLDEGENSWEQSVRLLGFSASNWVSHPRHTFAAIMRVGFFEQTEPGQPATARLHTRWLMLAGDPLEDGLNVGQMGDWERVDLSSPVVRGQYLEILASWLRSSRPLFVKYSRQYQGDDIRLVLNGPGSPPQLALQPPMPWHRLGLELSDQQIAEAEASPGPPAFVADLWGSLESREEPEERPRTPEINIPEALPLVLHGQLEDLREMLQGPRDWAQLATQVTAILRDYLCLGTIMSVRALQNRGPIPETLRSALQRAGEPEPSLKLLHFCMSALRSRALGGMRDALVHLFDGVLSRWLGLPDNPQGGLENLAWWTLASQGRPISSSEAESQLVLLIETLNAWNDGLALLLETSEMGRDEQGLITGEATYQGRRISLDLERLTSVKPLAEVLHWLGHQQSRLPTPEYLMDDITEYVDAVATGGGLMIQGLAGAGKSLLVSKLHPTKEGERWVHLKSVSSLLLERLNEELGSEGLVPSALADVRRFYPGEPLGAYLLSLSYRNQRSAQPRDSKVVFVLDGLRGILDNPWVQTHLPSPYCWVATTQEPLPHSWPVVMPPARIAVVLDDPKYRQFVLDSLHPITRIEAETLGDLCDRPGVTLLTARLWVGMLESGLVQALEDLPAPSALPEVLASRVASSPEYTPDHLLLCLLSSYDETQGVPLELLQAAGVSEESLARLVGSFPTLFLIVGEGLRLCHECLSEPFLEAIPEARELLSQALVRLVAAQAKAQPEAILRWALAAHLCEEAAEEVVFTEWFRRLREETAADYETRGLGHRKIELLNLWIALLESMDTEANEEKLWAYSSRALTYRALGCLDHALEDVDRAVAGFEEMLERKAPIQNGMAAALNRRSEILRERREWRLALEDADRAVALYSTVVSNADSDTGRGGRAQLEPLLALALHNRGAIRVQLGQLENAAGDLKLAMEHYRPWLDQLSVRIRFDLAQALRARGDIALLREEFLQARDDAQWALQQLQRLAENNGSFQDVEVERARCLHLLAEAHLSLEDPEKALQVSDEAAQLWQHLVDQGRLDLRPLYAQELSRRGQLLWSLGSFEEAMAVAQPSVDHLLQLVEAEGRGELNGWLGQSLLLRGRLWQQSHKVDAAKRDYSLAYHYLSCSFGEHSEDLPSADHHDALTPLVETGICLAELHLAAREENSAANQLKSVLQLLEPGALAAVQEKRARLLHLLGRSLEGVDLAESMGYLDQAVDSYGVLVDEQGQYQLLPRLAEAHLGRARVRHRQQSVEGALEDAETALQLLTFLSEKGGDPGVLALLGPARLDAAEILLSLGQPDRALQLLEESLEEMDMLGNTPPMLLARAMRLRGQIRSSLQEYETACDDYSQAIEIYQQLEANDALAADLLGQSLLLRSQVKLHTGRTDEAIQDVLTGFGLGGQTISEGWERFELLLQTLREQARRFLSERNLEPAIAAYDQLIGFAERGHDLASPEEIRPYLVRAFQERGLARFSGRDSDGAISDLSQALQLSCLVSVPGRGNEGNAAFEDAMLVARLYETRSQVHAASDHQMLALLDLGRALETLAVPVPQNPPPPRRGRLLPVPPEEERSLSEMRLVLYRARADLAGRLGMGAEEWHDLGCSLELMLPMLALGDEAIYQGVVWVHRRRAQLLAQLGQRQAAQDQYREAVRSVRMRMAHLPEEKRREQHPQLLDLLFERWRSLSDADQLVELGPLSEALEQVLEGLRLTLPVRDMVPLEPIRVVLQNAEPARLQRVAQLWMQVLSSKASRMPEEWLELFPLTLQRAVLEGENLTTLIPALHRLEACAVESANVGCPPRPWVGETFQHLMHLPTATWTAHPQSLQAFRRSVEAWQRINPEVAALARFPGEQLQNYLGATLSA